MVCCAVRHGGARKRTQNQIEGSSSSTSITDIDPELRSLADWDQCKVEVLRLALLAHCRHW